MTTINITLHSYPESSRSLEQMRALLNSICNKRQVDYSVVEQKITRDEDIEECLIKVTLERDQYANVIDDLYECKDILDDNDNLQDYDDLFPYDFTISVESSSIDPVFERVRYRNEILNDNRSMFFSQSISDISQSQESQEERLQAIEEYMKSSGIIYYQAFIETLLTRLSELNLVDIQTARKEFFEKVH